jgi:hypothetical protein
LQNFLEGNYPTAGGLLDYKYQGFLAGGADPDSRNMRLLEGATQMPRVLAQNEGWRSIADPAAVAAGLRPELYTTSTPYSSPATRLKNMVITGASKVGSGAKKVGGALLNIPTAYNNITNTARTTMANSRVGQAIIKSPVGTADVKLGKFASTGKGNAITGFIADLGMMIASGNWDIGALVSSAFFNLISAIPKVGGPFAAVGGLLATAATGGDVGRALAGTIGGLLGGLLGNLIPIPFVGGMVGSILGSMFGDLVWSLLNPEKAAGSDANFAAAGKAVYNIGPNVPNFGQGSTDPLKNIGGRIGGRAFGGSVRPNVAYMVGERGPEIMVPGGLGGSIIPNHKIRGPQGVSAVGGGQTVNASVVINNPSVSNAGDIDRLAKKVAEAQTRALRSAGYVRPS